MFLTFRVAQDGWRKPGRCGPPRPNDSTSRPANRLLHCEKLTRRNHDDDPPAIPKVGACPSGWMSGAHSCVKMGSPRERDRRDR